MRRDRSRKRRGQGWHSEIQAARTVALGLGAGICQVVNVSLSPTDPLLKDKIPPHLRRRGGPIDPLAGMSPSELTH